MAKLFYARKAANNPIVRVFLQDSSKSDGSALTGLSHTSSGLRIDAIRELDSTVTSYTAAASNLETITTIGTYAAPTSGKARFKAVDATNMPGLYEIHLAQALFGAGDGSRSLLAMIRGAANLAPLLFEIQLTAVDPEDVNQIPDALLKRDWTSVTGEAARSALNALRMIRNKWAIAGTTLTVKKEDDSTNAWTATITTDASAQHITGKTPN